MKTQIIITLIALLTSGALAACGSKPPPPDLDATATHIAANILATQTAEAPTITPTSPPTHTPTPTPTSTNTPPPTSTPTNTPSPTPTDTPLPTPTPTLEPTDTPIPTPIPPTPTPTTPPPSPTPVDETERLIIEGIVQASLIGGDKWGLIVVNCHETDYLDWYIEEPRDEHRLVAKIPAYRDGHCGVSHLEGLYSSVTYDFGFFAPWLGDTRRYEGVKFPAGQIGVLTYGRGGIQLWGDHADLKANLSAR